MDTADPTPLVGRSAERSRLHRLLADAKNGRGRALVLRGEAGIGKTALLDDTAEAARDFRVLRVTGVESEAEIPFAGLQPLFASFTDRLDDLPGPQSHALRQALDATGEVGDGLLAGAATP